MKNFYLGAAHGLAVIFFILMRTPGFATNRHDQTLVKRSIDYLITLRFPSGNYPSSLRSLDKDKLVHWCHGSPGFLHMFLQAYKAFGDEIYLKEAIGCGESIWKRGLLKKGYGLCHGPSGNAYGLLAIYQTTKDPKWLYRALKFADWILDFGKHGSRIPDRPYSLFEGLAGAAYYLLDLAVDAENSAFPAFY